jgi:nucleoside-diphosphate-sugar epimerase
VRIAVTGAAGYLASVLIPRLDARPEVASILALDVRPPGPAVATRSKVRFERADVRSADFARLFGEVDAVLHLAFVVTPIADAREVFDVNVLGSERVFEGAARAGVRQIVYASSIAAYGAFADRALPLTEESPLRDQSDLYYMHTKFLVEERLDRFEREHPEVAVARLRPGAFVGPNCANALGALLRAPVVFGLAGGPPIQFSWDEDVADAFVLALVRGARGAFIVTADEPITLADAARVMKRPYVAVPRWLVRALVGAAAAAGGGRGRLYREWLEGVRAPVLGTSAKIRRELGYSPRCPTSADAIRRLAEAAPAGIPNPGVALYFGILTGLTRIGGGRLAAFGDELHELRGVEATVDFVLSGEGGSTWNVQISEGRARFAPGRAAAATSTLSLETSTFVHLLSGELAPSTAFMTGKVRVSGEGHARFILGILITAFRSLPRREGLSGFFGRSFAAAVLRAAS